VLNDQGNGTSGAFPTTFTDVGLCSSGASQDVSHPCRAEDLALSRKARLFPYSSTFVRTMIHPLVCYPTTLRHVTPFQDLALDALPLRGKCTLSPTPRPRQCQRSAVGRAGASHSSEMRLQFPRGHRSRTKARNWGGAPHLWPPPPCARPSTATSEPTLCIANADEGNAGKAGCPDDSRERRMVTSMIRLSRAPTSIDHGHG
jgi:hypothetical protein